jgi:hypothetical protein
MHFFCQFVWSDDIPMASWDWTQDVHLCPYVNLNQPVPMFAPTCLSHYFEMRSVSLVPVCHTAQC